MHFNACDVMYFRSYQNSNRSFELQTSKMWDMCFSRCWFFIGSLKKRWV